MQKPSDTTGGAFQDLVDSLYWGEHGETEEDHNAKEKGPDDEEDSE